MKNQLIKFPALKDAVDEGAFEDMVPQISDNCSVAICMYCGRKYVRVTDTGFSYCQSPPCFVKGVLSALSASEVNVNEDGP